MQLWIFFEPGAGGDGFCNLLEQSEQCRPIDNKKIIRIHRYVDLTPKFWMPTIDNQGCFRYGFSYNQITNQLDSSYVNFVNNDDNSEFIVIASHDTKMSTLNNSDSLELLKKNQLTIRIKKQNIATQFWHWTKSNLNEIDLNTVDKFTSAKTVNTNTHYDYEFDVDNLWHSWESFDQFCKKIGIFVERKYFELFRSIKNKELYFITPGIEYYQSSVENNILKYKKLSPENATINQTVANHYFGHSD